MNRENYLYI